MQPLLKIQSIPIKIEAQTKRASLQHSTEPTPAPKPQRRSAPRPAPAAPQRPNIEAQPQPDTRINQNRAANRAPAPASNNASNYLQDASKAVQAFGQSAAVSEAVVEEAAVAVEYQPVTVSTEPLQNTAPASFDYSMDRETFDWNASSKPQLEYVPASIEYSISQYPQVVIEYVGEPIYVPASSNPNYVPPPEVKGKA